MKIAISTEGDSVSAHFGRCPYFTIIEVENSKVIGKEVIDNPGHHPGFLPQFLNKKGVNTIVAGGMGQRAVDLFAEAKIGVVIGISGKIDQVVEKLQNGTLEGGESLCKPGLGKGYGLDKAGCDHPEEKDC
ncbi:MAG: NifB/NifX family molybdenum-iron cluster-binding protein [Candidatus Omnitrophica bacterium]|nr:NifB/NifX family molybdenum-iron cluster-binding protein [Candidatus Omnitrophota bacterium]